MNHRPRDRIALIALGANLPSWAGPPEGTLQTALHRLARADDLRLQAVSRFWRTPAHPAGSGPDYVNACAALATALSPEALLATLHRIEADLGRTRDAGRWAARGIDIDLLAVDDMVAPDAAMQTAWRDLPADRQAADAPATLILPHPRLQDRGFVLAPLSEIAPRWRHPLTGATVATMLSALPPGGLAGISPIPVDFARLSDHQCHFAQHPIRSER